MSPRQKLYKYDPDYVVAPGESLKEWLRWAGISKEVLSKVCKIDLDQIDLLLNGDLELSDDIAKRLSTLTGIPASFWLAMEHNYRVGLAAGKERL